MTNSQKEFEAFKGEYGRPDGCFDIGEVYYWACFWHDKYNEAAASWRAKLDEGIVAGFIFRAIRNGGGICELNDANGVAKAIIEYMRGE